MRLSRLVNAGRISSVVRAVPPESAALIRQIQRVAAIFQVQHGDRHSKSTERFGQTTQPLLNGAVRKAAAQIARIAGIDDGIQIIGAVIGDATVCDVQH